MAMVCVDSGNSLFVQCLIESKRPSIFRNPWKRQRLAAGSFSATDRSPIGRPESRCVPLGTGHRLAAGLLNGMRHLSHSLSAANFWSAAFITSMIGGRWRTGIPPTSFVCNAKRSRDIEVNVTVHWATVQANVNNHASFTCTAAARPRCHSVWLQLSCYPMMSVIVWWSKKWFIIILLFRSANSVVTDQLSNNETKTIGLI